MHEDEQDNQQEIQGVIRDDEVSSEKKPASHHVHRKSAAMYVEDLLKKSGVNSQAEDLSQAEAMDAGGFSEKIDEGKGSNKEIRKNEALEQ